MYENNHDSELNDFLGKDFITKDLIFQSLFAMHATLLAIVIGFRNQNFYAIGVITILVSGFFYPVLGYLEWGSDTIEGFRDFSGGLIIYGFSGSFGLAAAILLFKNDDDFCKPQNKSKVFGSIIVLWILKILIAFILKSNTESSGIGVDSYSTYVLLNVLLATISSIFGTLIIHWFFKKMILSLFWGMLGVQAAINSVADSITNSTALIIGVIISLILFVTLIIFNKKSIGFCLGFLIVISAFVGSVFNTPLFSMEGTNSTYAGQAIGSVVYIGGGFMSSLIVTYILLKVGVLKINEEVKIER